jgi:arginine/lysine/ornithine decarboxylase
MTRRSVFVAPRRGEGTRRWLRWRYTPDLVIPYPPGFPITASGQVITEETITFMRKLAVNEIHCCHTAQGLKLLKPAQRAACTTA